MPLVPMKQILDEAAKGGYGVGAFNLNNMEQCDGIFKAALETDSPLIIQVSKNALKYAEPEVLSGIVKTYASLPKYAHLPVALHLDHGIDFETVQMAVELGFTSIMIDGSLMTDGKTPSSYEYNRDITRKVVEYAHPLGVTVEGEIGVLGGIEDGVGAGGDGHVTDPDEAVKFISETGLDALALAIGTSHGAYKFKETPKLRMDILDDVHARVPGIRLVMHGSSSVPAELVEAVNKYGGQVPGAKGVPLEMIDEAVGKGINKINIDTDGRLAITAAIRKVLSESPEIFDPRKYLGPARDAIKVWVAAKMVSFGSAGHARDYKPMTLADAAAQYKARG